MKNQNVLTVMIIVMGTNQNVLTVLMVIWIFKCHKTESATFSKIILGRFATFQHTASNLAISLESRVV